jgi:hypothetical protein
MICWTKCAHDCFDYSPVLAAGQIDDVSGVLTGLACRRREPFHRHSIVKARPFFFILQSQAATDGRFRNLRAPGITSMRLRLFLSRNTSADSESGGPPPIMNRSRSGCQPRAKPTRGLAADLRFRPISTLSVGNSTRNHSGAHNRSRSSVRDTRLAPMPRSAPGR